MKAKILTDFQISISVPSEEFVSPRYIITSNIRLTGKSYDTIFYHTTFNGAPISYFMYCLSVVN